jgi:hypothetical protein
VTPEEALEFVREHGVVLASAKGPAPRLTEAIAGGPIKGSWWAHPQGRHIFRVLDEVANANDVLACRLIEGKVTLVHRRLWPALVRLAPRFATGRLPAMGAARSRRRSPGDERARCPRRIGIVAAPSRGEALISRRDAL